MSNERRFASESQRDGRGGPRVRRANGNRTGRFRRWRVAVPLAIALLLIAIALGSQPPDPATEVAGRKAESTAATRLPAPSATTLDRATSVPGSGSPPAAATATTVRAPARPIMPARPSASPAPTRRPGTPDPEPSTNRFVVMDGGSGATLFQRNGYEPVAPASLTKIMTAILGVEYGNLKDRVKVNVDARNYEDSTVMGLEPWFDVTLEDILYGLMLPSGNDAAEAVAHYVAGTTDSFVKLMNQKASWLGLRSTHFTNPHGLDATDHYSSPYDMAVMARYGMQYPDFRDLSLAKSFDIRESNISYRIFNLNPMLWSYPGADGVKVGYTESSGRSIVASATRNDRRVFVAFMKSRDGLAPDATLLLDWAFASFVWP